jgi:hypothetical protein
MSPETASKAGAGALLLAFAIVELWLESWAAGSIHRLGALLVAAAGAGLLARAVVAAAPSLPAHAVPRGGARRAGFPHTAEERVFLAELAPR